MALKYSRHSSQTKTSTGGGLTRGAKPSISGFTRTQMIGFIGCIFLIIGCFTPIISLPIIGSINYFRNGSGDGVFVLFLVAISFIPLIFNKYIKILHITGLISLCMVIYAFFNISNAISEFKSQDYGMFNFMSSAVQIEYGWAFLIIGSILVTVAPLLDF